MNLTRDDLIEIHNTVQRRFKTAAGIKDMGILDSIAERPDQIIYGKVKFPSIYTKGASLIEALIRWHPFIDGNKRTGLLAAETLLRINGYFCLFPLHAVRLTIRVAKTKGQDQGTNDRLIKEISIWLRKYSASLRNPTKIIAILRRSTKELECFNNAAEQSEQKAKKIFDNWLAIDIYPEYEKEISEAIIFIEELQQKNIRYLQKILKREKRRLSRKSRTKQKRQVNK